MSDQITPDVVAGFREMLREFRGVGDALVVVVERTARLEEKVDRLVDERSEVMGLQARLQDVENWFRAEMAARSARNHARGFWIGCAATVAGGSLGAVFGHFWK